MKEKILNLVANKALISNITSVVVVALIIFNLAVSVSLSKKVTYMEGFFKEADKVKGAANAGKADVSKLPKPTKTDHIRGNKNAQIALILYSDYDCPFCSKFHETTKQVIENYGDKILFVYRHFPLDQLHPNARKKAEAAECVASIAGEEAFWNFTDALYTSNETLDELSQMAANLGVDTTKFNACVANNEMAKKVEDQYQAGAAGGVQGTPGDFIMNIKTGEVSELGGAVPYEMLKTELDKALTK